MNEDRICVLGLGETVKYYHGNSVTIGVNDIYRHFHTDYLVCIDRPGRFNKERWEYIKNSKPKKMYSQLDDWKEVQGYEKIVIKPFSGLLNWEAIGHSNNSPFVACIISYLLGFKEIVMYGVDFNTHNSLKSERHIARILKDYKLLYDRFQEEGITLRLGHEDSVLYSVIPVIEQTV